MDVRRYLPYIWGTLCSMRIILWSSYLSEYICITILLDIYSVLHIYLQLWTLVSSNISILPVILMLIQHTLSFLYKKYALFIVLKRPLTNLNFFKCSDRLVHMHFYLCLCNMSTKLLKGKVSLCNWFAKLLWN